MHLLWSMHCLFLQLQEIMVFNRMFFAGVGVGKKRIYIEYPLGNILACIN